MRHPVIVLNLTLLFTGAAAHAGGLAFVDTNATGSGDGTSWTNAYPHLADALAAAAMGTVDEIRVAQGTYMPDTSAANPTGTDDPAASFELPASVTLNGGYAGVTTGSPGLRDPEKFIASLDGDGIALHVLTAINGSTSTILDGFTITGGVADGLFAVERIGGGLLVDRGGCTLRRCTFELNAAASNGGAIAVRNGGTLVLEDSTLRMNEASSGGAINISSSTAFITDTEFESNSVTSLGGALFISGAGPNPSTVTSSSFSENDANGGGGAVGVGSGGDVTFTSCEFQMNESLATGGAVQISLSDDTTFELCLFISNTAVADGGAIASIFFSTPTIVRCTFESNQAEDGGAILLNGGVDADFRQCAFRMNQSTGNGGAVFCTELSEPTFGNCLFEGNIATGDGGAFHGDFEGISTLVNCTVVNNQAGASTGGIRNFNTSNVLMTNTIVWGNTDGVTSGLAAQITNDSTSPTIMHSTIEGWDGSLGGVDNNGLDPQFIGPPRLTECSPMIDAGDDAAALAIGSTDLAGAPRLVDRPDVPNGAGTVDRGCYEVAESLCVGDIRPAQDALAPIGNNVVNIDDLLAVINDFGMTGAILSDIDSSVPCGNGVVNIDDLIQSINAFGACPR
ncbi:MAG: hypothetical protein AAF432_07975 [Planctomycetota bacterium]